MIRTEDFAQWRLWAPIPELIWRTPSGLSIVSHGMAYSAQYHTDEGQVGTELVVHGQCDIEITFDQTVDCLLLEVDVRQLGCVGSTAYWLTLRDHHGVEFHPGPCRSGTFWHDVPGPFKRLTLSTLPMSTVHIRQLEWRPACRH